MKLKNEIAHLHYTAPHTIMTPDIKSKHLDNLMGRTYPATSPHPVKGSTPPYRATTSLLKMLKAVSRGTAFRRTGSRGK